MEYETTIISDWNQLNDLEPSAGGWVYRGQADSRWELESSLRRTVLNNRRGYKIQEDDFSFAERSSLRSFQSRAHFYLNHLPDYKDLAAWLAIMQHHGAPTRMLDFSYSLYIAIYFAVINAVGDSCVWAIDDGWLMAKAVQRAKKFGVLPTNKLRFGDLECIYKAANLVLSNNTFDRCDSPSPKPGVMMVEIEQQIPRLAIQQGVFLMQTDLSRSFVKNLGSPTRKDNHFCVPIRKYIFPYKLRDEVLMNLSAMNITAETLFPGIDGFATSLMQQHML